jgi:TIR domain
MWHTAFVNVDLVDCDCSGAVLDGTRLLSVPLHSFASASRPVIHKMPSHVDYKTVLESVDVPDLKDFLCRTGMPDVFAMFIIDSAKSLRESAFSMMLTTFISFGAPDQAFAARLHEELQKHTVTTFFFPEHAPPGQRLHRVMREGVNKYDRIVLICSEASLERPGVLNEIEEALAREARDGGTTYLIPIRLDDYVFRWSPSRPDIAQAIRDRVVADFTGATGDDAMFSKALARLLSVLKK